MGPVAASLGEHTSAVQWRGLLGLLTASADRRRDPTDRLPLSPRRGRGQLHPRACADRRPLARVQNPGAERQARHRGRPAADRPSRPSPARRSRLRQPSRASPVPTTHHGRHRHGGSRPNGARAGRRRAPRCHGTAELDSPLDSRILLAGSDDCGYATSWPCSCRLRLAVLSACETLPPGTDLPDEVVSLPAGLLQAGVGGGGGLDVGGAGRATAMLMIEFYRLWRHKQLAPVKAAPAQQWLRPRRTQRRSRPTGERSTRARAGCRREQRTTSCSFWSSWMRMGASRRPSRPGPVSPTWGRDVIRIEALPAQDGDCLWLEWPDSDGVLHRMLVDGGRGSPTRVRKGARGAPGAATTGSACVRPRGVHAHRRRSIGGL